MKVIIGMNYRYPNSKRLFKLIKVDGYIFRFKCGHWCTDNVFEDLKPVNIGKQQSLNF
jgi:hypothetical protein